MSLNDDRAKLSALEVDVGRRWKALIRAHKDVIRTRAGLAQVAPVSASMRCYHCHVRDNGASAGAPLAKHARCGACGLAYYCCAQHQRDDWPMHKSQCKPQPTDSVASGRTRLATILSRALVFTLYRASTSRTIVLSLLPYLYTLGAKLCLYGGGPAALYVTVVRGEWFAKQPVKLLTYDDVEDVLSIDGIDSGTRAHFRSVADGVVPGAGVCAVLMMPSASGRLCVLLDIVIPPSYRLPAYRDVVPQQARIHASLLARRVAVSW